MNNSNLFDDTRAGYMKHSLNTIDEDLNHFEQALNRVNDYSLVRMIRSEIDTLKEMKYEIKHNIRELLH